MSTERSSDAIVLRRSDSSESDRRLTLLTRDFGKLDVVAKGARKSGSRLAGSSEPMIKARFAWAEGKYRRFVTQVEPVTSYPKLRADYDRLVVGTALVEVVAGSLEYESEAPEIYDLVDLALEGISERENFMAAFVWALARLMVEEGQGPDWMSCSVTGARLDVSPAAVSAHAGGYVCRDQADQFSDVIWVEGETLIALSKISLLEAPPEKLKGANECADVVVRAWKGILNRALPACDAAIREVIRNHE